MVEAAKSPEAPYTLVQVDPLTTSTEVVRQVNVAWTNLSVGVSIKNKQSNEQPIDKPILQGLSGEALPGELLAIVGPPGAGKTTLLDCLVNLRTPTSGRVHVNGQATHLSTTDACYIPKDDLLYPTLTVLEHLTLQAKLRLGSTAAHNERVAEVLEMLELPPVVHSLIGQDTSKAQHKLITIATELLSQPSVLLLDNPIAKLDLLEAEILILQLRKLARVGHTVIITVLQPPSVLFELFDKLYLLADGRTVFHGRPADSIAYLKSHGLTCPPFTSPFEFFAQQLTAKDHVQRLAASWATRERSESTPLLGDPTLEISATTVRPALATQLRVLVQRNILRILHDKATFRMRLVSMIALAVIIGLVYLRLDVDQTNVQPLSSACFFISVTQFVINAFGELAATPREVSLVVREHKSRLYHALTWYVVKNVVELPQQLFFPLVFLAPGYFLVGYPADAEIFFTFYLFVVLIASTAAALVYFASCVAPRSDVARPIMLLVFVPWSILGGAFVNRKTVPVYLLWLQQISPIKYGYHGMMRAFWNSVDSIYCPPHAVCRATSGAGVLTMNVIKSDKLVSDCLMLIAINLALRALGAVALWRRTRQ